MPDRGMEGLRYLFLLEKEFCTSSFFLRSNDAALVHLLFSPSPRNVNALIEIIQCDSRWFNQLGKFPVVSFFNCHDLFQRIGYIK